MIKRGLSDFVGYHLVTNVRAIVKDACRLQNAILLLYGTEIAITKENKSWIFLSFFDNQL